MSAGTTPHVAERRNGSLGRSFVATKASAQANRAWFVIELISRKTIVSRMKTIDSVQLGPGVCQVRPLLKFSMKSISPSPFRS
jgi:hypothetical protein